MPPRGGGGGWEGLGGHDLVWLGGRGSNGNWEALPPQRPSFFSCAYKRMFATIQQAPTGAQVHDYRHDYKHTSALRHQISHLCVAGCPWQRCVPSGSPTMPSPSAKCGSMTLSGSH